MKIVTLLENTSIREDLHGEHGLSLYIETKQHKILFDAGETGAFAENAQKLGVDLRAVDFAVLSHAHRDHSGGLVRFLELNKTAPVYLRPQAYQGCYNRTGTYIGLPSALLNTTRLQSAQDIHVLGQGMTLYSGNNMEKTVPVDSAGLTVLQDGICQPDTFLHEQYLLIEEEGIRVLISGCSHKGILNISRWFQPDVLIGGFHYMGVDIGDPLLEKAANTLLQFPTRYYTGHCTGLEQYRVMKKIMGDRLQSLSTGVTIVI